MSTLVAMDAAAVPARPRPLTPSSIALLGCGTVGRAVARLLGTEPSIPARITTALVRHLDAVRPLGRDVLVTSDPSRALSGTPQVVVEVLGGTDPARSAVLEALNRGIPVVTANKTLLARHGRELREAALARGTPLLYEAAVLAGVPFLGTFARRPLAAAPTGLVGILNGTTNFLISRAAERGTAVHAGLPEAQRLGYAEPDPSNDLSGTDAAEKLAVLLQHFAGIAVPPHALERQGIEQLDAPILQHAAALGGVVKPIAWASWAGQAEAFVGPAFVPVAHPLARVDGVENALLLECRRGRLLFQGPGAGPEVTAATILDDVAEILSGAAPPVRAPLPRTADAGSPETEWLIALEGARLPRGADVADYLGSFGLYIRSTSPRTVSAGVERRGHLTWPASPTQVHGATARLAAAAGCRSSCIRALGDAE